MEGSQDNSYHGSQGDVSTNLGLHGRAILAILTSVQCELPHLCG